jgi:cytidylate kinase
VAASDAVMLDSTHLNEDQVLERIEALVNEKLAAGRE